MCNYQSAAPINFPYVIWWGHMNKDYISKEHQQNIAHSCKHAAYLWTTGGAHYA